MLILQIQNLTMNILSFKPLFENGIIISLSRSKKQIKNKEKNDFFYSTSPGWLNLIGADNPQSTLLLEN